MIVVTHEHDIAEQTSRIIHLKDGLVENDVNDSEQKQKVFESLIAEER
jgi:ABC-type lipoprotein export system ATPase subunit